MILLWQFLLNAILVFFFIKNEKQAFSLNNLSSCYSKIFKYKVSFDLKFTLLRDL